MSSEQKPWFSDKPGARDYSRKVWSGLSASRRKQLLDCAMGYIGEHQSLNQNRLFLTVPIQHELDLFSVIQERLDCDIFLPVIYADESMHFVAFRLGGQRSPLREGRFKILEPVSQERAVPIASDLVVIPSLACNHNRFRLGRGGGFFDRYFDANPEAKSARKVSILPVELIEIHFPEQSHDVKLDELLTDTGTVESRS